MKVEVIAEIGQAHDGSLGILHSYIDALADSDCDAIKFQMHIAMAESSEFEPFRINFSYEDKTRYDYWHRMEFTEDEWMGIKKHCEEVGKEFLCSPFSIRSVELLEKLNVKRYKIASGEVRNFLMLDIISQTGKPIIVSSGLSSFSEIQDTIDQLKRSGCDLSVMQCTSSYPVAPEELGLNVIQDLKQFGIPVGLSDHSGKVGPPIAAVALGASLIETHVVFDRRLFGPDSKSSLTIEEFNQMIENIRFIETSLSNPVQKVGNESMMSVFGKSLAVNKNLSKGHIIRKSDLETKKPMGYGYPAENFKDLIGKKLNKDLVKYSFVSKEDIEGL